MDCRVKNPNGINMASTQCITSLLPLIMSIVNTSLETGPFPEYFGDAIVIPHINKPNLDCVELKHYRPLMALSDSSAAFDAWISLHSSTC